MTFAQAPSGVTGVVTDVAGAVVAGANVTLTDTKTSRELKTKTNDQGSYTFQNVAPGAGYKLTFELQGFQTFVINQVSVATAVTQTYDAQLTAGQVSAVIEVTSTTGEATLNTTDASIGNVIGRRELNELPIQFRGSPAALLGLQPGVVGANLGTSNTNRVGSVAGSRADQTNITVDGIDVNDQATGQAFSTVGNAPIDSIQEFRGTVAGFDASSGRGSGGQINLTRNSGTNEYHGNVREYWRHESFAANSFFNNSNKISRPALRRHQYGASFGGPLPFFNFGENDGPMFHSGKDRLFFFVDSENRRDRQQFTNSRTVPLQTFRNGQLGYIRATNAQTGATCTAAARANDPATTGCIGYLSTADLASLDPQHIGVNTALLNLYNSRFPLPNDLTGGDGINTGLFRFNSPSVRDEHITSVRIDGRPTDNQSFYFSTAVTRRNSTNSLQFLPGDDDAVSLIDNSYSWAAGHNWVITPSLTNLAVFGITKSQLFFAPPDIPTFPYSFSGGTIGSAFPSLSYQDRLVTTPTLRDELSWTTGAHSIVGGLTYKPIRQLSHLTSDFNFVSLGLGGLTANLNTATSLRPANLLNNTTARSRYDTAFATLLGRIATVTTNFNYNSSLNPLPPGSGKVRNYAYNESEFFIQDTWKVRNNLSLNLGVRYVLYPAPYEVNGILASDSTDWETLFAKRVANAAAGIAGNSAEPFLTYNLAGKTNDAPPLYATDKNNFAPRIGFAYSPTSSNGLFGKVFGERKTSIRGSAGVTYDRVSGAILFIQNQSDYLFQNSGSKNFGNANALTAFLTDPRFTGINTVPAAVNTIAPTITRPYTPFVDGGVPFGGADGETNYAVDHNFKTPLSYMFDFSIQRELPGNHLLTASYVGRLGRKLFVQSDVAQVLNFKDPASGQFLFNAFNQLQARLLANSDINALTAIPWFENQVGAAVQANYGLPCGAFGLGTNCTQLAANLVSNYITPGDTSDAVQTLSANGALLNNVGISGQFATNAYVTNQGTSDYHGLLLSLQKRYSNGIKYSINYTYSKSLDNNSSVANTVFGGLVCDVLNPDVCRGPSDFDIRHIVNGDFIAQVPIGRGRWIGGNMNRFANAIVGGWTISGIFAFRSGLPFSASPSPSIGVFPLSFVLGSPAIVTNPSALRMNVHTAADGTIQFFDDPAAANAAIRDPFHGELGSRNVLRGPSYWNLDMRLSKRFLAPWSEHQNFQLLVDAFNVTNTNIFGLPGVTRQLTATPNNNFGRITGSANSPRELQFGLRFEF